MVKGILTGCGKSVEIPEGEAIMLGRCEPLMMTDAHCSRQHAAVDCKGVLKIKVLGHNPCQLLPKGGMKRLTLTTGTECKLKQGDALFMLPNRDDYRLDYTVSYVLTRPKGFVDAVPTPVAPLPANEPKVEVAADESSCTKKPRIEECSDVDLSDPVVAKLPVQLIHQMSDEVPVMTPPTPEKSRKKRSQPNPLSTTVEPQISDAPLPPPDELMVKLFSMRDAHVRALSENPPALSPPWQAGIRLAIAHPGRYPTEHSRNGTCVVVKDPFPKAEHHYLVCPAAWGLDGVSDLNVHHLPLLEAMYANAQVLIKQHEDVTEWIIGFHSVPSMWHLHMHVISADLSGSGMKSKKHYNSFTTPFFIKYDDAVNRLKRNGSIIVDSKAADAYLKEPMKCVKCASGMYDTWSKSHN